VNDMISSYFEASEAFFKALIDAHCEKEFLKTMQVRADKIARDLCLATDEHVTDILKGQLSICYELADGTAQALKARSENANSEDAGGYPDAP